jgi:glycoside hydrolase-like protein
VGEFVTVIDYAFPPHPTVTGLRAAGATGVCRYLCWQLLTTTPKILTPQEYAALRAAGLDVVLNWEYDAEDLVNPGFDPVAAAREAVRQANALPYPDFRVIYWSADFNVTATQWPTIRDRLRQINTVIGVARTGLYGPYDALEWARRDGVASWFWQAGMSTSWSSGRNAALWPGAHLRQRRQVTIDGADCDINDIIQPDYGQQGRNMPTDPMQINNIEEYAYAALLGTDAANIHPPTGWASDGAPTYVGSKPTTIKNEAAAQIAALKTALADAQGQAAGTVTLSDADRASIVADLATQLGGAIGRLEEKVDALLGAERAAVQAETAALTPPAGA